MNPTPPQAAGSLNRFLNAIEAAGNKLPHITMLFIWALVITLVISLALSYVSFDYRHPSTGAVIAVTNMLAPANLLDLVVNSVKNFMGFPPLGITLVATLGIGIAEGSGFIHTLLRKLMSYIPRAALTPAVVIVSILCHVASDSVYVILMPLAALMFYCAGRHPLAGVACSFAGLSGGFTASYTPICDRPRHAVLHPGRRPDARCVLLGERALQLLLRARRHLLRDRRLLVRDRQDRRAAPLGHDAARQGPRERSRPQDYARERP